MISGVDGSGAVHTVLPWEALGGHVPSGGSEMYWFDQSIPIHLFYKIHASGTLEMPPLDADASQWLMVHHNLCVGPYPLLLCTALSTELRAASSCEKPSLELPGEP